jgi:hypothetical protein
MFVHIFLHNISKLGALRYVMLGNHRDAWGFGALDPSSGTAQLMEVVRLVFFLSLRRCFSFWGPGPLLWHCSAHGGRQVSIHLKSTEVFEALGPWTPSSGTAQLMEVVRLVFFLSLRRCSRLWGPGPQFWHCTAHGGRVVRLVVFLSLQRCAHGGS